MRVGRPTIAGQRGFTYLMVMAAIALLGVGLAAIGPRWADEAKREREQELLRIGELYAGAIKSYYFSSPGNAKRYPPNLESLVLDTRFAGMRRHLRRPYADPLLPSRPWGIVRGDDGGIRGVFSQDERAPLRQSATKSDLLDLPAASSYSQWQFVPRMPS